MEAVLEKKNWPKFLKVNGTPEKQTFNKYLLKPWKKGEIVKVVPWDEQKSSVGETDLDYRKRYVSVIRKDNNGAWTLKYTWTWEIFELMTNK